ncbi:MULTISPECIES: transcriptional regulator CynR [unclassified Streptomyces]|uniref:transcriptional regulator CynR n=1 Tax=unclassified Streptomyces TaxID=2593676 RepID=UPI00278C219E|nr:MULTISPECIES: transcriptional regulator CynR [unclassified Streptomyces]
MSVELRQVRYFMAVVEHAGFTRAAEALRISQPTLSQQVRQLERSLGTQLLDRGGRIVRPTDAGRAYLEHARRALRDLAAGERAIHDVRDLSRGHLRLGVTPTFTAYLVGPLVAALRASHPGITVAVRELTQDRLEAELLADDCDLGIAFQGGQLPGIAVEPLFTESLSLVTGDAEPGSEAADGTVRPWAAKDLGRLQLALLSQDFATRGRIDDYFAEHQVRPRIALEANSLQTLIDIVQRTGLTTVLPDPVTHGHPRLTPLPVDPPLPTRTAALLSRADGYRSTAAAAFARLVREHVEARPFEPPEGHGTAVGPDSRGARGTP